MYVIQVFNKHLSGEWFIKLDGGPNYSETSNKACAHKWSTYTRAWAWLDKHPVLKAHAVVVECERLTREPRPPR